MPRNSQYLKKTYSLNKQVIALIKRLSDYYAINASASIRLAILKITRDLGLIKGLDDEQPGEVL